MRQLSGKAKKAILGLVLAMSIGAGGRAFAGDGYYCWVSCNGCTYTVWGCDTCDFSIINCTASGTNCQGDYGHCG